jgi:hypothetical protein
MLKEGRLDFKDMFGREEDTTCLEGIDLPLKAELAPV